MAVAGNLQISGGKAAIGSAIAYNDVGNSATDKQKTSASISNTMINNGQNTTLSVNVLPDESELTTIGIEVGTNINNSTLKAGNITVKNDAANNI